MAIETGIGWTDHTWSPWWGCTKVSPGCDNCYANALDRRTGGDHWGAGKPRRELSDQHWRTPLRWDDAARKAGVRRRVFPSMCDPFDNDVPDSWRQCFWQLIRATPNLDWLLLTKRIGNAERMLPVSVQPTVWLGATVVNQEEADRDVPKLLAFDYVPVRFVSYEPALGPVVYTPWLGECTCYVPWLDGAGNHAPDCPAVQPRIDWLIVGGESGPNRRTCEVDWLLDAADQAVDAGSDVYLKQDSALRPGQQGRIPDQWWSLKQSPQR